MKNLSKKEMAKLERSMGITHEIHNRPSVGRPVVFFGKTNKQMRREGKQLAKDY